MVAVFSIFTVIAFSFPIQKEVLIVSILSGSGVFLFLGYIAMSRLLNNTNFICEVTDSEFRYQSPVKGSGVSFTVSMQDIVDVFDKDDTDGFFIKTDKEEYWVSDHFGNPTYKIKQLLKSKLKCQQADGL